MCTRCACPIAWGCHVNSFCRQNLVAVLTPTTRFSTNLVPRLRVHYRCKGELKGLSLNARIHGEMFRATCLAMFWRLCGILCCLSTKHSRDWQNVKLRTRKNYWNIFVASWRRQQQCLRQVRPRPLALKSRTRTCSRSRIWRSLLSTRQLLSVWEVQKTRYRNHNV